MEARAIARYVRISPRKARQVVDCIRGRPVDEALTLLRFMPKRAAGIVAKVVQSAAANAVNNYGMERRSLVVARAYVDQGPVMKRIMPRARGAANRIRKRTSHITVVLDEP
ncbi:MAG TPA: 50S ribosomal protein L22 [Limnochordia bacterium]